MKDLLVWFFGRTNPYHPGPPGPDWYPAILTVRWWRWCLRHGFNGLARERIRLYYVRRIKYRVLRLPICWMKGHKLYKDGSWGWSGDSCSRCHRTWIKWMCPRHPAASHSPKAASQSHGDTKDQS